MQKNNLLTYILAASAVVVVGLLIRKEFFVDEHQHAVPEPINYVGNIDTMDVGGITLGPENAEVTVIEFFDYECPFCKQFQGSVDGVLEDFEDQVQVRYVHFPLPNHPNATKAAFVAECANRQNRFSETHKFLFDNQVRLSTVEWENAS